MLWPMLPLQPGRSSRQLWEFERKDQASRTTLIARSTPPLAAGGNGLAELRELGSARVRAAVMAYDGRMRDYTKPTAPPQEGFVRRLLFKWCDTDLRAGRTESSFDMNGRRLTTAEMQDLVDYARRHGFLQ